MKTHTIIFVAAIFAFGCSHKPDKPDERDTKIAKLETRVSDLEARCDLLTQSFTNLLSANEHGLSTMQAVVEKEQTFSDNLEAKWEALLPLLAALTNPPPTQAAAPRSYYPVQQQPSAYATKDGVPIAVYNQIAASAAREWPGDYDMQAWEIKKQVAAYLSLHR